jgi:negative regulator of sigma E activity
MKSDAVMKTNDGAANKAKEITLFGQQNQSKSTQAHNFNVLINMLVVVIDDKELLMSSLQPLADQRKSNNDIMQEIEVAQQKNTTIMMTIKERNTNINVIIGQHDNRGKDIDASLMKIDDEKKAIVDNDTIIQFHHDKEAVAVCWRANTCDFCPLASYGRFL